MGALLLAAALWSGFLNPPDAEKPWCYWWWINGHADREPLPDSADVRIYRRMRCSGPSADDPLQSSGILGPVVFECSQDNHRKPHPKGKMQ